MAERAVALSAVHPEAERLANLPEYEYAAQVQESARRLDLPVATLERLVSRYRAPDAVVIDALTLGRRLGKLVFLLGADDDKAVLAAARAMGNALRDGGRDWSYLSALVAQAEPAEEVANCDPALIQACEAILRSPTLTERERGFVSDMRERFSWGGFEATDKQKKWFRALYDRCVRNGR